MVCIAAPILMGAGVGSGCHGHMMKPTMVQPVHAPIQIEEIHVVKGRSYDAQQLFREGNDLVKRHQCLEALPLYNQIFVEFAKSRYVPSALYNAALCTEDMGRLEAASGYFALFIEHQSNRQVRKQAVFRLLGLLFEQQHWQALKVVSERALKEETLDASERLELMARSAQASLGLFQLEIAQTQASDALKFYRAESAHGRITDKYFAAAANYVLAEVIRLKAWSIQFPNTNLEEQQHVLATRAQLLLDAQAEYYQTILLYDKHWIAASGYRIGAMYDELWHAIMNAPVPPNVHPDGHAAYRNKLATMIKPLLRHAVRYLELSLMVIQNAGMQVRWSEDLSRDIERVKALLLEQPSGPEGLPAGHQQSR